MAPGGTRPRAQHIALAVCEDNRPTLRAGVHRLFDEDIAQLGTSSASTGGMRCGGPAGNLWRANVWRVLWAAFGFLLVTGMLGLQVLLTEGIVPWPDLGRWICICVCKSADGTHSLFVLIVPVETQPPRGHRTACIFVHVTTRSLALRVTRIARHHTSLVQEVVCDGGHCDEERRSRVCGARAAPRLNHRFDFRSALRAEVLAATACGVLGVHLVGLGLAAIRASGVDKTQVLMYI